LTKHTRPEKVIAFLVEQIGAVASVREIVVRGGLPG
jgi:hypothetical protein